MHEDTEKLPPIAVNRKARFDYFIEERFEAGISLHGLGGQEHARRQGADRRGLCVREER